MSNVLNPFGDGLATERIIKGCENFWRKLKIKKKMNNFKNKKESILFVPTYEYLSFPIIEKFIKNNPNSINIDILRFYEPKNIFKYSGELKNIDNLYDFSNPKTSLNSLKIHKSKCLKLIKR